MTFSVMDASGNHAECTATVSVFARTPRRIAVVLDKDVLWPPNHKFVMVCAEVTVDNSDAESAISLVSITSDESANGRGDGNTGADIRDASFGTPDRCFELRAERAGNGDGRVYEIVYCASDGSGNAVYDTALVRVPHDMSSNLGESQSAALTSVYPNPFNPQTTVEYSLLADDRVRIVIYDARGAVVRSLVDQPMPAGEHRVRWNGVDQAGRPVGSGIYFVKMAAGSSPCRFNENCCRKGFAMNLDEQIRQAEDKAVEYLNATRLDDIEGRFNFHGITKSDANLLIQAVRGLHRRRKELERQLAKMWQEIDGEHS